MNNIKLKPVGFDLFEGKSRDKFNEETTEEIKIKMNKGESFFDKRGNHLNGK